MKYSYICDIILPTNKIVGVDYDEGSPVPIPNTEVKLISAEDTWLETARDNRKMPTHKADTLLGICFLFSLKKHGVCKMKNLYIFNRFD